RPDSGLSLYQFVVRRAPSLLMLSLLFLSRARAHRDLPSFPTRRSSDLERHAQNAPSLRRHSARRDARRGDRAGARGDVRDRGGADRKSTRLNSSHLVISYAVFCLKKKTIHPVTRLCLPRGVREPCRAET